MKLLQMGVVNCSYEHKTHNHLMCNPFQRMYVAVTTWAKANVAPVFLSNHANIAAEFSDIDHSKSLVSWHLKIIHALETVVSICSQIKANYCYYNLYSQAQGHI